MIHKVHRVWDAEFHGIECLESNDEYGFEGCYNNDINHPDPRPGHAIWINKLHAEKLFRLFNSQQFKLDESQAPKRCSTLAESAPEKLGDVSLLNYWCGVPKTEFLSCRCSYLRSSCGIGDYVLR